MDGIDGNKIRLLRKKLGISAEELANMIGFTPSYISQVERNKIEPSLSGLKKICNGLNVSIYEFFDDSEEKYYVINRANRKVVVSKDKPNINLITPTNEIENVEPKFCVYELKLKPNEADSNVPYMLNCHKTIIVKSGVLSINLKSKNIVLEEGDSIFLTNNTSHMCYNPTWQETEVICVTSNLSI